MLFFSHLTDATVYLPGEGYTSNQSISTVYYWLLWKSERVLGENSLASNKSLQAGKMNDGDLLGKPA